MIVYAITSLFFTNSETSKLNKKTVFQFNLTTDMSATEVGPGDSFDVKPVVYSDATEEMYVFIQIDMPTTVDGALFLFDTDITQHPNPNSTIRAIVPKKGLSKLLAKNEFSFSFHSSIFTDILLNIYIICNTFSYSLLRFAFLIF